MYGILIFLQTNQYKTIDDKNSGSVSFITILNTTFLKHFAFLLRICLMLKKREKSAVLAEKKTSEKTPGSACDKLFNYGKVNKQNSADKKMGGLHRTAELLLHCQQDYRSMVYVWRKILLPNPSNESVISTFERSCYASETERWNHIQRLLTKKVQRTYKAGKVQACGAWNYEQMNPDFFFFIRFIISTWP